MKQMLKILGILLMIAGVIAAIAVTVMSGNFIATILALIPAGIGFYLYMENSTGTVSLHHDLNQKVVKSEEVNRPNFKRYYADAQEAEGFEWNDEGYLTQGGEYVTYGRYNDRMNRAVCDYFGKQKCEKLVGSKQGWNYAYVEWGDTGFGSMCDKEGIPIDWYVVHDELAKL